MAWRQVCPASAVPPRETRGGQSVVFCESPWAFWGAPAADWLASGSFLSECGSFPQSTQAIQVILLKYTYLQSG